MECRVAVVSNATAWQPGPSLQAFLNPLLWVDTWLSCLSLSPSKCWVQSIKCLKIKGEKCAGNSKYLYHSVYFKFKFWCWSQLYKPHHQFPHAHLTVVCWKGLWAGFWPLLWPCVAWARVWPSLGLKSTHLQVGIDCLDQLPQPFWVTKNFEILLKAMDTLLGEKKNEAFVHWFKKYLLNFCMERIPFQGFHRIPGGSSMNLKVRNPCGELCCRERIWTLIWKYHNNDSSKGSQNHQSGRCQKTEAARQSLHYAGDAWLPSPSQCPHLTRSRANTHAHQARNVLFLGTWTAESWLQPYRDKHLFYPGLYFSHGLWKGCDQVIGVGLLPVQVRSRYGGEGKIRLVCTYSKLFQ